MTVIRISIYLLTFWFVFVMGGNMLPCKDSVESYICFNVDTIQDYVHTNNPEPLPTKVNISLKDIDIIDVDESQQTVTLLMKVRMAWSDDRIDVNRSQSDKDKYVFVEANINICYYLVKKLSNYQQN